MDMRRCWTATRLTSPASSRKLSKGEADCFRKLRFVKSAVCLYLRKFENIVPFLDPNGHDVDICTFEIKMILDSVGSCRTF